MQTKLQQAPAIESKVQAVIPKGGAIKVGDCGDGWCRVSWNGYDGYALTKSIRLTGDVRRNTPEANPLDGPDADDDANATTPDVVPAGPSSPD